MARASAAATAVALVAMAGLADAQLNSSCTSSPSFYVKTRHHTNLNGTGTITWDQFQGKVLMFTNVASFCGETVAHYTSINNLLTTYASQGFAALGTPSNDFNQEPGDGIEILHCLQCVRPGNGFDPLMPLTSKLSVTGLFIDQTWKDLEEYCPAPWSSDKKSVAWNFETVLFARNGSLYRRYSTPVDPKDMEGDVKYLLSQ